MPTSIPTQLRWMQRVTAAGETRADSVTARERLVMALVDGPRTVAQLARAFGLSQPTVLEQTRRALRDELIVEVAAPAGQRRVASERYYALAVPVVRQPDRDLLSPACSAVAQELAGALLRNQGDLLAAFAMTPLAREGWEFAELWPYLNETICQMALEAAVGFVEPRATRPHGLAWVDDGYAPPSVAQHAQQEESA